MLRAALAVVVLSAALAAAPPAAAEDDPYGVVVDRDGVRWTTMSVDEYLVNPVVQEVERRMRALASRDFRAGEDVVFDSDASPRWTVVQDGRVTRILDREGRARTITYVGPARECRRTAGPGEAFSIASDAAARFTCRERRAATVDGAGLVAGYLPSAAVLGVDPAAVRVLIPEATLLRPVDADEVYLQVRVKDTATLAVIGLLGGPVIAHGYWVRPTRMDVSNDEFNGVAWRVAEFQLSTRGVPDLPRSARRHAAPAQA